MMKQEKRQEGSKMINTLVELVSEEINGILRTNLYENGLSEIEIANLRAKKSELRAALRNCGIGDVHAKTYVKQTIKNIISSKLVPEVKNYELYIPFSRVDKLTSRDKFDILLYHMMNEHGDMALAQLLEMCISGKKYDIYDGLSINDDDIEEVYSQMNIYLTAGERLDVLTQRVYSQYKGLGVIDDMRDMKIEGVSGGVSGKEGNYNSVWLLYKGMNVHVSCLSFESEMELERICMNIYRYGSPGQLSKSKGYIVNEMKDHSRVVVVRPSFSESFAFFVRKFDTIERKAVSELITDRGWELVEEILKYIIRGCQVSAITGAQGTGKTTLLMSLIDYIPAAYTLRIQEMAFELHLRDIYPDRNILTFQETEYVSGQEGLDIQKKTDGVVNILGEIASNDVAAWMIQMSQVGSLFTIFTHHAKTTENLIKYMRNALIISGSFNNEKIALEQVVDAVRFDIHVEKDIYGHRYIERISEIVKDDSDRGYRIEDIIRYGEDGYMLVGGFSENVMTDMKKHMSKQDREAFNEKYNIQAV